jgi:hypothetical protein
MIYRSRSGWQDSFRAKLSAAPEPNRREPDGAAGAGRRACHQAEQAEGWRRAL